MIRSALIVFACTALLMGGCASLVGTFADMSNVQTTMKDVKLEQSKVIKISHGGAVERIPLSIVRSISLHHYESMTIERELYFLADVELRDGSILAADKDPNAGTYVCVNDALLGTADKSHVRVPLDKISRILFK